MNVSTSDRGLFLSTATTPVEGWNDWARTSHLQPGLVAQHPLALVEQHLRIVRILRMLG